MILFKKIADWRIFRQNSIARNQSVGFVPTMGALHAGHISLLQAARSENDWVVCSIFVNPTQFNDPADFAKYPITLDKDIAMLEATGCDVLFLPDVEEMYPKGKTQKHYELGALETIWEGKFRPGHFQGVCQIVDQLLSIVTPHRLYLGQKDYQQCMVLTAMASQYYPDLTINICSTLREADGLAMSSRNLRLDEASRKKAPLIYQTLLFLQKEIKTGNTSDLAARAIEYLKAEGFQPDYVAVADAGNLETVEYWNGQTPLVFLIAAFLNDIRLIDNLILTEA